MCLCLRLTWSLAVTLPLVLGQLLEHCLPNLPKHLVSPARFAQVSCRACPHCLIRSRTAALGAAKDVRTTRDANTALPFYHCLG